MTAMLMQSAKIAREKARELSLDLKSYLTNMQFLLKSGRCFTLLYFGDADSSIVRETWARLIDQALSRGGVAEACSVLKRVGSCMYPGEGTLLPLDTLCLHLDKAALERLESEIETQEMKT
ncbi:nuclear pore complex protein NUP155-like [Populus nigra]|uniref:nuclear pore complex protein NUP155-like n=1 Tax=Populus nigra TaxID=3691 RepID=UPI002B26B883|nr:nuclear pore complex protein NUP155-like [Populus nigra]